MDMVLSGRYYDFDYDNNSIIIFDADDAVPSIDWDPCYESDDQLDDEKVATKDSKADSSAMDVVVTPPESVSTDTIPDHSICDPRSASLSSSRKRSDDSVNPSNPNSNSSSSLKRKKRECGVAWISSESPKGSKRIPYAIQVAHSYTISKLKMQLTTLVHVDTLHKQAKEEAEAKARAKAKRHAARLAKAQAHAHAAQTVHAQQQYPQYQQYAAYNTPPRTAVPVAAAYRGHPGHPLPHPHAQRMVYRGHPPQHVHPAATRGPQEVYYRTAAGPPQ